MVPAEGGMPGAFSRGSESPQQLPKPHGSAAADTFGLEIIQRSSWGGKPSSKAVLGPRARRGRAIGRMCRERVEGQEGCAGFNYSSHLIISPLNMMDTPPPRLLLALEMFKVPGS